MVALNFRFISVNHSDYKGPPKEYCPPKMADRHDVYVDYLQTDDALPYPAPSKDTSEAAVRLTVIAFFSIALH